MKSTNISVSGNDLKTNSSHKNHLNDVIFSLKPECSRISLRGYTCLFFLISGFHQLYRNQTEI